MRKVLCGYARDRNGNVVLIGTNPVPHSNDKSCPRERKDKRHLVRRGATIFKKEFYWIGMSRRFGFAKSRDSASILFSK